MSDMNLPKGFENAPEKTKFFHSEDPHKNRHPPMGMRRGPGGPGAMGRAIEKPKNAAGAVKRLLGYFKSEKKLLIPLIIAVI